MYKEQTPAWIDQKRDRCRSVEMFAILLALCSLAYFTFGNVLPQRWVQQEPLRFTEDGSFQIAIFEDFHFGESMPFLLATQI